MRNLAVLWVVVAAALSGCSTVNVSGGGGFVIGVPQISTGLQASSAAGVFVNTAFFAALTGIWRDPPFTRVVPEMLEGRGISEVDCTQPIHDWSQNLRCK